MEELQNRIAKLEAQYNVLQDRIEKVENGFFRSLTILGEGLTVFDSQGRRRVRILLMDNGDPYLCLMNEKEKPLLTLFIAGDTPYLNVHDEKNRLRLSVGVEENQASVVLYDDNETLRMMHAVDGRKAGEIVFFDEEGHPSQVLSDGS